jgi:hypothetical protein
MPLDRTSIAPGGVSLKLRSKCASAAVLAAFSLTAVTAAAQPVATGSIKVTGAWHFSGALSPGDKCLLYARPGVLQVAFGKSTAIEIQVLKREYHNLNLAHSHSINAIVFSFAPRHRGDWVAGAIGQRSYGPGSLTVSNNELSGHLTATMHPQSRSGKVLTSAKPIQVVAHWNCVNRD